MIPIQILCVIFGIVMMYVVRIHYGKKRLDNIEYVSWILIWFSFIFAAIFPQTFRGVTEKLHIARVFDLLVIIGLMIVITMTLQNRMNSKDLEKKLEEIIRKRAIDGSKK